MRHTLLIVSGFAALLLTGCINDNDSEDGGRKGYETRFYENQTFVDSEIGYTVSFPASWKVDVAVHPLSNLDLLATQKNAFVYIFHTDIWAGETFDQYVAHRTGENSYADSEVVYPPELRGGVTVQRVDQWFENEDYIDYEWV